jgi:hypothetical protein
MREHHKAAIQRLVQKFQDDPRFPALIVAGSVAKGDAKENSDIDVLLIATPEEFLRRRAAKECFYHDTEICDYPGGYIDGKIVELQFIVDAADHGSEPARAAFEGAIIAYSRIAELDELLERIPIYPEKEQTERMKAFYSQLVLLRWFADEAEKKQDPYLMTHVAADLVLFGGRLILAHNKILYPSHKRLMGRVAQARDKPEEFITLADQLLRAPSRERVHRLCDCVFAFLDWDVPFNECVTRFIEDSEWNWREGRVPLADC